MEIAALVLGIISLVCSLIAGPLSFIGSLLAIIGIILGALGLKSGTEKASKAKAGLIMSIIALVLGIIMSLACLVCIGATVSAIEEMDWEGMEQGIEQGIEDSVDKLEQELEENWEELGLEFEQLDEFIKSIEEGFQSDVDKALDSLTNI